MNSLSRPFLGLACAGCALLAGCQTHDAGDAGSGYSSIGSSGSTYQLSQLDALPKIVEQGKLVYPPAMYNENKEGKVLLLVTIDTRGRVTVDEVLDATNNAFAKAAINAAESSRYEVPRVNGHPASAQFEMPCNFRVSRELRIKTPERLTPGCP